MHDILAEKSTIRSHHGSIASVTSTQMVVTKWSEKCQGMQDLSFAFLLQLASPGGENDCSKQKALQSGQRRKNRKSRAFVSEWVSVSG